MTTVKTNLTAKIIKVYGFNSSKGNTKGDVICYEGEIYEMSDFNPSDFDITGEEEKQLKMCQDRIKEGEEKEGWELGHVTAQIENIEWQGLGN